MSRLIARIAVVLAVMFTVVTPAANAQDSPLDLLQFLDGLESAHARRYVNHTDLNLPPGVATPAVGESTPASLVEVTVLEFESPDSATAAFDMFANESLVRDIIGEDEADFAVMEEIELGDRAFLFIVPSGDTYSGVLLVQDGNLGHLISGNGDTEAIQETLMAFGEFMVDAEPGGEIVLGNYADSTGGTWDVMPAADDTSVLGNLVPMYDYNLLESNHPIEVPEDATPAA